MGSPVQAKGTTPTTNDQPAPAKAAKPVAKTEVAPSKPVVTSDKERSVAASAPTPNHDKAKTTVAKTSEKPTPSVQPAMQPHQGSVTVTSAHNAVSHNRTSSVSASNGRLARVTAYWSGEGDYYTGRGISSTGIHLHEGHCAVDPRIIPYGSVVQIAGLGKYLAVDTGSAVISREAARETGHNPEERNALVIDLYFESRKDGERFAAYGPKFAAITWTSPSATGAATPEAHTLFADENWNKIQNKQL